MVITVDGGGLLSTACTSTTTYTLTDDEDAKSTTVSALSSTLATTLLTPENEHIYITNQYIDSLSDEQLVEMEKKLSAKEDDFLLEGFLSAENQEDGVKKI